MSSGYLELYIEQGEDFSVNITLDALNGYPYDLTSHNVKSEIRKSHWSECATATFTANVANTSLGIISLSLPANTTQEIVSGKYVYDVFITDTSIAPSSRSKVLEGIIYIEPSSTKI